MQKDCTHCTGCSGCGGCSGCSGALFLTEAEVQMLQQLGQIPFLPIARTAASASPIYLEQTQRPVEEYSRILEALEKKQLISLDFDRPLKGFDDRAYAAYPIRGSMALTARGQRVLELLELQGIE